MRSNLSLACVLLVVTSLVGQDANSVPKPVLDILDAKNVSAQKTVDETSEAGPQGLSPELVAVWKFLAGNAEKYRLSADASNLSLIDSKTSLLGSHYYFQQTLGGLDVDQATIVVSTNKQGQITKVYTSAVPVTSDKVARATKANITEDAAYETAWNELGARGEPQRGMFGPPSAKLLYLPSDSGFRLAYAVDLYVNRKISGINEAEAGVEEPGLWRVNVDAITGDVIGKPMKLSTDHKGQQVEYDKRAGDRQAAFEAYTAAAANKKFDFEARPVSDSLATGSARVFDPDPVTTLKNPALHDGSPAADFAMAYQTVALLEVTETGGKFFLDGPWVRLADFEPPNTDPSSTTNGRWTAERGDLAFNDAMTYFHIDRSQRYIQSLGFSNIQAGPIVVDANGVNGTDNSHFVPSTNRLAFGHGCIDDNQDADVILHEYGHAITHAINPNWFGGDSGGIGEGFGDYWAESSSYASPNGPSFQTFQTFDWDAAGGCWPGRRLDITSAQATYDPTQTYGAHQPIGGGVASDELWSTPLYQAHVKLRQAGVPRAEIDQIVLQSMFGIGSGFSMRDLAKNVVDTAKTLFPMGSHATVFETEFKALNILP